MDLGDIHALHRVEIVNREAHAERLRHFTLLTSVDGQAWTTVFRKGDAGVFGADGAPYVVALDPPAVGRFLRLRLDDDGVLHFHQLRAYGRPASPPERAEASNRSAVEAARQADFAAGRQGEVLGIGGFSIFTDTERYSPPILGAFRRGDYEGREREVLRQVLRRDDRVLEVGTAIGLVSMTAAAAVRAASVRTFDANAAIVADARRNFAFNGLGDIQADAAVLKNRRRWGGPGEHMAFGVSRDFWSSRLGAGEDDEDIVEVVQVPTQCLEDELAAHRANVLICDIEGGEIDLLLEADLNGLDLILLETHYWATGERAAGDLVRKLVNDGFDIHLGLSGAHVTLLQTRDRLRP